MCGICGFYQLLPEADRAVLKRMNDRLIHRGPDDEGYFSDDRVGLATRRLSIIDLSTGHQPLASFSGNCWIAYNGEVYNFGFWRQRLEEEGIVFRTRSDTEVVVNLYEMCGLDFVQHLRGMFAFAIYDRPRQRLVLARDRLGKKPLYYSLRPRSGNLVFGSEIKALLQYPGLEREIDLEALDWFLTLEYIPAPFSIFKNIRKLPAGHMLVYEKGNLAISRYWDVQPQYRHRPFPELREEFLSLFEEAVRLRMIADVPLGAFLSGGLDSSSIVAMMARHADRPIKTFSIGFEERSYSELPYSRLVAEHCHTEHQARNLAPAIQDLVWRISGLLDEPLGDFSNFPTYLVSQAAREQVAVVLSGDGGDEIFGGYEHYLAQKLAQLLDRSPLRPWYRLLAHTAHLFPPSELKKGWRNRIQRFSAGLTHSPINRHFRWLLWLSDAQKRLLYTSSFLRQDFLAPLPERSPFAGFFNDSQKFCGIDRDLYLDLKTYLVDDIMVKVDRMSMAVSLEVRAPLLDQRLVEFAFSLPPALKVRAGGGKWFFKKAMQGILPPEIIHRQKEGFTIPLKNWLKNELRGLLLDTLSENKINGLGLFNYTYVQTLIREHLNNRQDHSHRLWTLVLFQLWHDHYMHS